MTEATSTSTSTSTERTVYIYTLCDPDDPTCVRYVGQTRNPTHRLQTHVSAGMLSPFDYQNPLREWLWSLRCRQAQPVMHIIETTTEADADQRERAQILAHHEAGWSLLNYHYMPVEHLPSAAYRAAEDELTVAQAAKRRGVNHSTILKAIQSGRLPAKEGFNAYLVRVADVDALVIRSHPSAADSPYVSIAEAARLIGVSRQRVYVLMNDKRLMAAPDARTDGRQSAAVRLRRADVEAFAAARRQRGPQRDEDAG